MKCCCGHSFRRHQYGIGPNAGTLKQMARARERAAVMAARYQAEVAAGASHMDAVRMVARSTGSSQRTVHRALAEVAACSVV